MDKAEIIKAYCLIRTIDNTIPDDVLDFMKQAAIEKLESFSSPSLSDKEIEELAEKEYPMLDRNTNPSIYDENDLQAASQEGYIAGIKKGLSLSKLIDE